MGQRLASTEWVKGVVGPAAVKQRGESCGCGWRRCGTRWRRRGLATAGAGAGDGDDDGFGFGVEGR